MINSNQSTTFGDLLNRNGGVGPSFDTLRLVLAVAILVGHSKWMAGDISVANATAAATAAVAQQEVAISGVLRPLKVTLVPTFFALSGFLVTGSALRIRQVKGFLLARAMRIFPALIVEVTLSALVLGPIFTAFTLPQYFSDRDFILYFGNIVGLVHFYLPGVFLQNPWKGIVNMNLWTLPAEFYCYLFLSFAISTTIVFRTGLYSALVGAASVTLILLSLTLGLGITAGLYSTLAIINYFFVGSLFYLFKDRIPSSWPLLGASAALAYGLLMFKQAAFVAPIFVVYCMVFFGTRRYFHIPALKTRDYSYGIYLYGFPIAQSLIALLPSLRGQATAFVPIACVAAFVFAAFSWHFIEKPLLKMKRVLVGDKGTAPTDLDELFPTRERP